MSQTHIIQVVIYLNVLYMRTQKCVGNSFYVITIEWHNIMKFSDASSFASNEKKKLSQKLHIMKFNVAY